MKVYAWLIDLIHRLKSCPTGMISGWVQKVTQHNGIVQYVTLHWRFLHAHNALATRAVRTLPKARVIFLLKFWRNSARFAQHWGFFCSRFIVLACDGLWKALTPAEVVSFVLDEIGVCTILDRENEISFWKIVQIIFFLNFFRFFF